MNGVMFTCALDGSRYIAGTKDIINATQDAGKQIEEVFNRKLKQTISIVAIEEATRRTAEWAQEIQNTSRQLGITATQTQELNNVARALALPANAATDAFQNMINAQKQALENNPLMQTQFAQLGVTMEDLHKNGTALWDILQKNIKEGGDSLTLAQKSSATSIFGQNISTVTDTAQAMGGKNLEEEANKNDANVSDQDVSDISKGWAQLQGDLMELGNALKPVVPIIISFADALVNAALALKDMVVAFKNIFNIKQIITHPGEYASNTVGKVSKVGAGVVKGLATGITGLVDLGASIFGYHPGVTQGLNNLTKGSSFLNSKEAQHGAGVGAILPMFLTEGATGAVGGLGKLATKAAPKLESIPLISKTLDSTGKILTKAKGRLSGKAIDLTDKELEKIIKHSEAISNVAIKASSDAQHAFLKEKGINAGTPSTGGIATWEKGPNQGKFLTADEEDAIQAEAAKIGRNAYSAKMFSTIPTMITGRNITRAGLVGAVGGTLTAGAVSGTVKTGDKLKDQQTVYNPFTGLGLPASGGANLKMGGMFGVGSSGEKLVQLNTLMERHLAAIAAKIASNGMIDFTSTPSSQRGPAGGM